MDNIGVSSNKDEDHDHDHDHDDDEVEVPLPGFRFHPTDEELVGFYLRRKVDNKPITLDLIKSIDIYKYDPWDLPKTSCTSGDKEWYFFCRRGRKYKNSIRPNRVTGSGFWKATGIDKPVNSHGGDYGKNNQCIGLKKTLVYYRGSAGKGTKTDWMMHEFRLPTANDNHISTATNINHLNVANHKADPQEAEIWTLCRIFKRNVSYRRYTPDWRELATKRHPMDTLISSKKSSCLESNKNNIMTNREPNYNYIDFSAPASNYRDHEAEKKPDINHTFMNGSQLNVGQLSSVASQNFSNIPHFTDSISSVAPYPDENDQFFMHTSWDELSAVVELALDPAFV